MNSVSSAQKFCKTARCPSSEMLLRYRRHVLAIPDRIIIRRHLPDCDFCSAELELLKRHHHEIEESRSVEMPSQFRRLAESLFVKSSTLSRISNVVVYTGPLSH
jgi:hypothetical protein